MESKVKFQSTHPHGVRLMTQLAPLYQLKFQSTHPHGVRLDGWLALHQLGWFQSTHPHGVRPAEVNAQRLRPSRFNPRTRTGCDPHHGDHSVRCVSFNPRTRTGCDRLYSRNFTETTIVSIHAPARGATVSTSKPLVMHVSDAISENLQLLHRIILIQLLFFHQKSSYIVSENPPGFL